jgi:hypothetical protein
MEGKSRFADTFSSTHLLDFRTNEKIPFVIGLGSNSFLTDDLLFLSLNYGQADYEGGDYISDRTTGKQYPIQRFVSLRKDAYVNSEPNLEVLANELRDAKDVFLVVNSMIIALSSNFQTSPERNFILIRPLCQNMIRMVLKNFYNRTILTIILSQGSIKKRLYHQMQDLLLGGMEFT